MSPQPAGPQRISIFPQVYSPPYSAMPPGQPWLRAPSSPSSPSPPPTVFAAPQVSKLTPSSATVQDAQLSCCPPESLPTLRASFYPQKSDHPQPCWKPLSGAPWGPDPQPPAFTPSPLLHTPRTSRDRTGPLPQAFMVCRTPSIPQTPAWPGSSL